MAAESRVEDFLRVENGDSLAAARRLVGYWRARREVFGPELAFLPMTLSGAMKGEMDVLKSGVMLVLPPDRYGRPILYMEKSEQVTEAFASAAMVCPINECSS